MKRYGMMLSALNEEMLEGFRSLFYRKAGIEEGQGPIIHKLSKIISYVKRGWPFDQRLGEGFKMIFQHYSTKVDKSGYEKYDHVIYIDVELQKLRTTDKDRLKAHEAKKSLAGEVTKEIEEYLVANELAIEIELGDIDSLSRGTTGPHLSQAR